ncbi:stage II sporulation protein M [Pelotomaculum propionicicum]|uniref:stage II sporulation protein M n=1 Tax=Pelotomaculum propionicicum TaxID=258475 RepID=UPI0016BAC29A|nr:stage II sporulation protein M [Pelotomaculum propionicicum]NLI12377.1 stage II sporulation protein M [Peptococcaceae bacterium]
MFKQLGEGLAASLRQNWPVYLTILLVFAMGIAAGVYGVQKMQSEQVLALGGYLDNFLRQAGALEMDPAKALRDVLYNDLVVILAVYLLGLTVIGIPVILGIIFTRGFVLGFTIYFLAKEKSIQGIVLAVAAVLPQNILLIPALLMGGVASLSFALLLARRFNNSKVLVWSSFVVYSSLMLVVLICAAGAGLVEVYITPFLVKMAASYMF